MAKCGAPHPDDPSVTCNTEAGNHPDHYRRIVEFRPVRRDDFYIWPNPDYVPPPSKERNQKVRDGMLETARKITDQPKVQSEVSHPVENSIEALERVEPSIETRKGEVLNYLRVRMGKWVDGMDISTAEVGGSAGLVRLRELRRDGWSIESRPHPTSDTAWQYRLVLGSLDREDVGNGENVSDLNGGETETVETQEVVREVVEDEAPAILRQVEGTGFTLYLGDCVRVMRELPESSIDSIVCDPPYGLKFMGRGWDSMGHGSSQQAWHYLWAVEAFRVLKPGGHILVFGGTRTYHRMASAVEDAGFEIRDQIQWLYGQGMPKGMNISKAIDKAAGAERSGFDGGDRQSRDHSGEVVGGFGSITSKGQVPITEPGTSEAEQWEGWHTALKPAQEPIVLARKPLIGTVAANVLEHGTGALNIDGTRVSTTSEEREEMLKMSEGFAGRQWGSPHLANYGYEDSMPTKTVSVPSPEGRWPANVILGHHPECVEVGTKKIKAIKGGRQTNITESGVYGGGKGIESTGGKQMTPEEARGDPGYGDEEGMETIEAWDCHESCPVRLLDEQTGTLTSGKAAQGGHKRNATYQQGTGVAYEGTVDGSLYQREGAGELYGDQGGASRFFYQPKASGKEREEGLKGRVPCPKCGELDSDTHPDPKTGKPQKCRRNDHPTVKPIDLMVYLCRLVTPPGGVVLDPFAGSGTTGIAAHHEGFSFIGIEKDGHNFETARGRIEAVAGDDQEIEPQPETETKHRSEPDEMTESEVLSEPSRIIETPMPSEPDREIETQKRSEPPAQKETGGQSEPEQRVLLEVVSSVGPLPEHQIEGVIREILGQEIDYRPYQEALRSLIERGEIWQNPDRLLVAGIGF